MAHSSQWRARESHRRLETWLAAGNTVPIHRGRVNRRALCEALGLVRSTLSSNPFLRETIARLDQEAERRENTPVRRERSYDLPPDARAWSDLLEENAALRRRLREVELLLAHGRSLR